MENVSAFQVVSANHFSHISSSLLTIAVSAMRRLFLQPPGNSSIAGFGSYGVNILYNRPHKQEPVGILTFMLRFF